MRDLSAYTTFPFELPVSVRPLAGPVPLEPDRDGEDGVDCWLCSTPDEAFLWTDERWRLSLYSPSSQRGVVLLQPRVHAQSFGDLPPAEAAELGPMVGRVQQAVLDLGGMGRVHVHYWGDGSAHLHVWFYPRPYGQLQLRGTFRTLWAEVLPELPDEELRHAGEQVAANLRAGDPVR